MVEDDSQLESNPKQGYLLDFSPAANQVQHDFCGDHEIPGALCPYCNKALLRILSLSAEESALNLNPKKTPFIHLLYCWTCSIPFGVFSYKINPDGGVELLQVPKRIPESEFGIDGPYDGYTGKFPAQKVSLEPLGDKAESSNERDEDDDDEIRHQIGGRPFIDNPQSLACPTCSKEMPLLAAICNDATGNDPWQEESKTFTGNGGVQMIFHFCRDCSVVSAYHSCD